MPKTTQSNGASSFSIVVLVKQNTSINLTCTWVKKSAEENLGPGVVLKMTESLENSHCMAFSIREVCMGLALPERIKKKCQRCLMTER